MPEVCVLLLIILLLSEILLKTFVIFVSLIQQISQLCTKLKFDMIYYEFYFFEISITVSRQMLTCDFNNPLVIKKTEAEVCQF